ncbi:hypothetical protein BGX27_009850 [Mortierella sp. AM989]|nr:hypothetical protein BGX27_009850 [Mortierella sp. AM989]
MSQQRESTQPEHEVEMITSDSEGNQTLISSTTKGSSRQRDGNQHKNNYEENAIFQNVIFYLNPFLGISKAAELEATLCANGALKTQSSLTEDEDSTRQNITSKPTHIITNDLDFPDYKHATARGIHIVKPEWVTRSASAGRLQSPEYFSADPVMIFSGIVLTTTGLPQYDRQLIRGAVEDYGGRFIPTITPEVTHMITLTASGEKYDYIMEHPELGIKVVLPHWFQLCCNLRRLLPETIYEFPDPPMLNPDYTIVRPESTQGYAPQLYSNNLKAVVNFLLSPRKIHALFLDGYNILFGDDLNILPERRVKIEEKIKEAGGAIINEYSSDKVDIVICRFRTGDLYIQASRDGKIVASADWLLHVLQTGDLPSPKASLLHYPIPPECVTGMSSLVITISNYTGNVREYLKRMILAMGASYKPTLSNRTAAEPTTHIICGNASGDKYEKGHEWNVKVVNHLWLEDCFQAWSLQSETKARYTLFPAHNQLSLVFGTNIPPETLDDWIGSAEGDISLDQTVESGAISNKHTPVKNQDNPGEPVHQNEQIPDNTVFEDNVIAEPSPSTPTPSKTSPKMVSVEAKSSTSDTSASSSIVPSSPKTSLSVCVIDGNKEGGSPSSAATESPTMGSVRVISRKRGAAVQASKVLQKIVPDMNEFQDELRDEKKASKKKKKHTIIEDSKIDETEMDLDESNLPLPTFKKAASSPAKRRRISMGSTGERSTPAGSDDDGHDHESELNIGGPRTPSKKIKRSTKVEKADKENTSTEAANTTISEQNLTAGKSRRVRYISTGLKDQSTAQIKALKSLGIIPTTAVEKCTHLVATSIARTGKFLIALLHGKIIVHEDWLQACIDANAILDEDGFRIEDIATEQKLGMNLYESLDRAREKRIFENCVFYLSPSMKQDMPLLKSVVEAGGGKASTLLHTGLGFLKDRVVKASNKSEKTSSPKSKSTSHSRKDKRADRDQENLIGDDGEDGVHTLREKDEIVAVVSSEKDKDMWQPILDAGAHVYSHDLISISVLTQRLDLGNKHALA